MSALFEKLHAASFRNIKFGVDEADISAGRRVQVHEYPKRDKPFVEDIGRATREIRINGYLVGADYVVQASALLGALETPGPGMLVHPWHGQMSVTLKELGRIRYNKALGYAAVEMSFIEAGELEFPSANDATQAKTAAAATDLGDKAVERFASKFTVNGAMDFVNAAARGDIQRVFQICGSTSIPGMAALGYASNVLTATASALTLINNPALLGRNILGAFNVFSLIEQGKEIGRLLHGSVAASASFAAPSASAPLTTAASQQQYANTVALYDLARQSLLVQAVGLSGQLPALVHDDVIAARNLLLAALDAEMLTASDSVYDALAAARTAVFDDLTARAKNGARIASYTPPETMPMLAIANEYYGDATRADEIVARNKIRNPLFVPPQALKVLAV